MPSRFVLALTGLGLLIGGTAYGQSGSDVRVAAEATPSEVGVDEEVTFEIRIQGAPRSAVEMSGPPDATNLVLQGPTPQTDPELSFDDGRLTRRVSVKWRYKPIEVGVGRFKPVTLRIRGEQYTTAEVQVRVVPHAQREQSGAPTHQRQSSPSGGSPGGGSQRLRARDVFIRASASADTAYENEQVTLEYRLLFRPGVRLRQSRMVGAWDAPGFWREELDVASRRTPQTTELFGEVYKTFVLKRVALFPTRTGRLQADPLQIETEARPRPELGQRHTAPRTRYEPVMLSSEALSIRAESLPSEAPSPFDGAVGTFSLDTEVRRDSVEVGDAVTLKARVRGTGNIATISPPRVNPPPDFDLYDPVVQMEVDRSGSAIGGTKTFSYTLVPRSNGGYTLPPTEFAYFDPETESYQTLRSDPITLRVTGDIEPHVEAQTGEGFPLNGLAGPIDENLRWVSSERTPLYAHPWAYAAVLVPVLIAAGAATYKHMQPGPGAVGRTQSQAMEIAQQYLREAHHYLRDGEVRAFYATVEDAVLAFFAAQCNDSRRSRIGREILRQHLTELEIPQAECDAIEELLNACDEAQFTPDDPSYDAMEATLDHAQGLLLRFDDSLSDGNTHTPS